MKSLDECRVEIDEIDKELARLFEKRMKLAKEVVIYKKSNNMEIFQPEREKEVLEKNTARVENEDLKPFVNELFKEVMEISKKYQKMI